MKNLKLNDLNVQELDKEEMFKITGGDNVLTPILTEIGDLVKDLTGCPIISKVIPF